MSDARTSRTPAVVGPTEQHGPDPVGPGPARPAVEVPARAVPDPDDPGWRRRPATREDRRRDVWLALVLFVGTLLSSVLWRTAGLYENPATGWVSLLCLAGVTLPLAARRRWPSAVGLVVSAAFMANGILEVPETLVTSIGLFVALYTIGAWEPRRRRAFWAQVLVVVAMFVWLIVAMAVASSDPDWIPEMSRAGAFSPLMAYLLIQLLTNALYFAGACYFGNHAWAAARERDRTAQRTRELEQERRHSAAQAVELERLRIARELHDAVAHHVSVIGIQAAAARTVLASDPAVASVALERVEDSAREAIGELHGILGMLRSGATAPLAAGSTAPPPDAIGSLGVDALPVLVAQLRSTGLPTTFQVIGEPARLPPVVSLNLYRVAQEALTNARKHGGPGVSADVRLRYEPGAVELEVTDDGLGPRRALPGGGSGPEAGSTRDTREGDAAGTGTAPAGAHGGLGLVGMRERVAADGGTLLTGARARGGYRVRVRVPLTGGRQGDA